VTAAATPVEAASAAAVKAAANAGPAGRMGARGAAIIDAAEGTQMSAERRAASTDRCAARKFSGVAEFTGATETGTIETPRSAIDMIVIAKGPVAIGVRRAAGDISVMVV
jgi:hypothetical protein